MDAPQGSPQARALQDEHDGHGRLHDERRDEETEPHGPPSLIDTAKDLGVEFYACEMSMNVMGLKEEELMDGVKMAGVATALADASESRVTLFI
ncbi:MAG: hypothetical protein DRP90_01280 [Planctomycetota bacterium]|nr:MAG: hypothetical protein DRP90_01280 [Planctomycetota bacterium]